MARAILNALAVTAGLISSAGMVDAASLETPTHKEIAPIKFPIGEEGAIKTIAMDSKGHLLVGVSWKAEGNGRRVSRSY